MDLMDLISSKLDPRALDQMSGMVEGNKGQTVNAIESILPMLMAGLSNNAHSGQAGAIQDAIRNDHDGSILDNLSSFLNQGPSQRDDRIADHVFGAKRPRVEQKVAQSSGLSTDGVAKLMATLAPLVMGALSKQSQKAGSGSNDLLEILGSAGQSARAQPGGDLISSLLDGDGDGDVDADDLTRLGKGLLSSFLQ